jgi:hypothetical protein
MVNNMIIFICSDVMQPSTIYSDVVAVSLIRSASNACCKNEYLFQEETEKEIQYAAGTCKNSLNSNLSVACYG